MRKDILALMCGIAALQPIAAQTPGVVLAGSEVRKLASPIVGHDFEIFVAKPDGYDDGSARYPTLYVLGAYDQFAAITQLYRILQLGNHVPPLLLVGISYPGTFTDYIQKRALDFTPTRLSPDSVRHLYGSAMAGFTPASGGADVFLRSLRTELIPYVEQNYRTIPGDRGILGMSYGGLFTATLLTQAPELFQRILIGSPALWWDDYAFFKRAPATMPAPSSPTRVVLTVGADETPGMLTAYDRLRTYLETSAPQTPSLAFAAMKFPGESHMTVQGTMYSRALRMLYAK